MLSPTPGPGAERPIQPAFAFSPLTQGDFIPIAEPVLLGREREYLLECVDSGWVSSLGRFVGDFERSFADYVGTEHCLSTCNGTVALHLALAALDIGPGDEVIVPDLTFAATANAVIYCGATPVVVDVDPRHLGLDVEQVANAVGPATRAILAVHLYGHPTDIEPLEALATDHDLDLIEDCAEAHGARYRGRRVGGFGRVSCFSFYGNKIMTTGEGGACCTSDQDLHQRMATLRDHGMRPGKRYWHDAVGFNYRLTNMQAAIGLAQLERIDDLLSAKRRVADTYRRAITREDVRFASAEDWAEPVDWVFNLLLQDDFPLSRDDLIDHLARHRIQARPFFYPLHQMPPYQAMRQIPGGCPVATDVASRGLTLPSGAGLSAEQIARVAATINQI